MDVVILGSDALEGVLAGDHERAVRAQAFDGSTHLGQLEVTAASFSGDRSSFARRTGSVTFTGPNAADWAMRPSFTFRIEVGAVVAGRPEYIPAGWFNQAGQPSYDELAGTVSGSYPDLGVRVVRHKFLQAESSLRGATTAQQIAALVKAAVPFVTIDDRSDDFTACPPMSWAAGDDRSAAINTLASSISCEAFFDARGVFVIQRLQTLRNAPDLVVRTRRNLVAYKSTPDFDAARNAIRAFNQSGSGAAVSGLWVNTDPASPFNVDSCGYNVGQVSNDALTTNAQAAQLAKVAGLQRQGYPTAVSVDTLLHPGIEAGERVDIITPSGSHRMLVDSFSWDALGATASLTGVSAPIPDDGVS